MLFQDVYDKFKSRVSAMLRGSHLPKPAQECIQQDVFIRVNTLLTAGRFPLDEAHQNSLVVALVVEKQAKYLRTQARARKNQPEPISDILNLKLDRFVWVDGRDETWDVLEELIPCLPEKYREVVDLRLQDKTFAEIAVILGISENLANVRHFRAVEKLREANNRRLQTA
jgi:RNA polymerase sigma factor (sigma-70 family)